MSRERLDPALLVRLDTDNIPEALNHLAEAELLAGGVAASLTQAALERAEAAPQTAERWLAIAAALNDRTEKSDAVQAQIVYARARLHLLAGDTAAAEQAIRHAQALWQRIGATEPLARSYLGLTQVLATQGRFQEAETAIQRAIVGLPVDSVLQAQARLNLANLLRRQDRHAEALDQYAVARDIYLHHLQKASPEEWAGLQSKLARLAVNQANALMYLDRPIEAEAALQEARRRFTEAADRLNQGRTCTNLGALYLRTGRYGDALQALREASEVLLDDAAFTEMERDRLRQADILLLEQANAYLALNLIPEAIAELERAIELFASANQPYELAQALYTLGMVRVRNGELRAAQDALEQAGALFAELSTPQWSNRVRLAQAILAFRQGDYVAAQNTLTDLLQHAPTDPGFSYDKHVREQLESSLQGWDIPLLAEAWLLQLRLHLDMNRVEEAKSAAQHISRLLGVDGQQAGDEAFSTAGVLPHLRLQLEHAVGCIALVTEDAYAAVQHFQRAITLLERQRIRLPLEEIKTAYLDDKTEVYSDLVFSLLLADPDLSASTVAEVFSVTEQARSRALLDRLYAAGDESETHPDEATEQTLQELRQRVHWLYNQFLSGTDDSQVAARRRELQECEAALQRLEWKQSALLTQAQPVDLSTFQELLAPDQQAIVYYVGRSSLPFLPSSGLAASGEVMAFVVDRSRVRLYRRLADPEEIAGLAADLRFQLGRLELGLEYFRRHRQRLMEGVQDVLGRLYTKLIDPLEDELHAPRLLIVPHGILHQLPLHSLWDGSKYLLERFECSYAPSASLAVHNRADAADALDHLERWAGLALTDAAIPGAREEVRRISKQFRTGVVYLDDQADRAGFVRAAQESDILHVATHGLFRPDNPFFSALKLADGWIDVRELYRLPLSARLVVLSACESGVGRVRGGDEVIGLTRGFLGAGARSLVVSLWNVHDMTAADLMEHFYRELHQCGRPAPALRAAQQAFIARGEHPYFWAPFLVIG